MLSAVIGLSLLSYHVIATVWEASCTLQVIMVSIADVILEGCSTVTAEIEIENKATL